LALECAIQASGAVRVAARKRLLGRLVWREHRQSLARFRQRESRVKDTRAQAIGGTLASAPTPCQHQSMAIAIRPRSRPLPAGLLCAGLLALALTLAACGKSSVGPRKQRSAAQGPGVPAEAVAVIEGWANALRAGQTRRAAAYWAHPSEMVNGPDESGRLTLIHVRSEHDALLADETLSCGATLHATARSGKYVRAIFLLGPRSGAGASKSGCSGPAGVDFLIRDRHIVRWLRAPVDESPGQTPKTPTPPAGEPGASGGQSI
jgi:hypothetical protein